MKWEMISYVQDSFHQYFQASFQVTWHRIHVLKNQFDPDGKSKQSLNNLEVKKGCRRFWPFQRSWEVQQQVPKPQTESGGCRQGCRHKQDGLCLRLQVHCCQHCPCPLNNLFSLQQILLFVAVLVNFVWPYHPIRILGESRQGQPKLTTFWSSISTDCLLFQQNGVCI